MDWTASGIKNTFRYEMLDPWCRESRGDIEVYSCSISEGYYTDAKAQADFEVNADEYIENSAIRIWHTAALDDEVITECIGTFIPDSQTRTIEHGNTTLELSMMHPLDKMATDYRCGDFGVAAGTSIAGFVAARIEGSGCSANIAPALVEFGYGFASAWVWEHGESALSAIQAAADACNYQVGADAMGNVTFYPYVTPAGRDIAYEFGEGELSVVEDGVKITESDIINCVVLKATKDQETLVSRATVAASHPWHFTRIGRWYSKTYDETQMENFTQAAVDAKAKEYLSANDGTTRKWEATSLYIPLHCGDVVTFRTGDGTAECTAMIQQRKIKCDAAMEMQLVLDEVI